MQFEEFASLQLDRPILHELRSEEQLKKHTLDSHLEKKPIDRALHLLSKGDDIQKLSVIQTLPSLLAGDAQSCISRLMPKMQQTLPTASTEFHMAASTTFKTILEQRLVSHSTFTQTFLQSILNSLDSRDPVVAHAWLETLLDVIELLPAEVIRHEILPMAINKGQLSQPISSRITCSKLVGKICTRFDSQLIKKEVLPTVHSLCQDVNSDVRACICLQLRFVAEGLGAESVKPALLPSIVELASDEESIVRHASVQTIVHLLPQLQTDVIKNTIAPLIKKLCDNALKSDDTVMCVIAQEFGKLALGLEKCLTVPEKTWLIKYFQQLSQLGVPTMKKETTKQEFPFISNNPLVNERYVECRWQCAFNIPAMFLFISSASEDVDVLLPTFNDLASDPYYMVRKTIACGIHEVARILGPRNSLIKGELIKLLKDDSEEVLQGLIPHVAKTCELLSQSQTIGTEQIDTSVMDLGRALLKCEAEIATTNNWRLSASMFEQMEILPKCFPSDFIYTYFVPVALTRALNARPMPVRLAAGRTFLVFLRYNLKATQRTELRNRLYTEFARNPNSYVRMLFIRMMIEAMDIFSSMYFKEYFYTTVLGLTEDPIANIRLKVVTLLPSLKSYIRLPTDKKLLSSLEADVRNLMNNEKDRDVIYALTNAIHKLDSIDVRHEGQPTPAKLNKHDSDDMKKYEEEKRLINLVPGKPMTGPTAMVQSVPTPAKKHPMTQKLSGPARMNPGEMAMGRSGRQNILTVDPQRSAAANVLPKPKQPGLPISMSDTPTRTSRQNPTGPRLTDMSKASTSSNDLTSSWAQLTSNSMLLTHLWERINLSDSNISVSSNNHSESSCNDYVCHEPYDLVEHTHINRFEMPHACELQYKSMDFSSGSYYNPELDYSKSRINTLYKHECYPPSALSKTLLLSHLKKERNTCWAFSSMPEIPVPLQDDEFLVDAGIRIPAQLSSCHSTSRIPKLQEIIYRNRRIVGNGDRSCSGDRSRTGSINMDKGKAKRHFSMHEDCLKPRSTSVDQAKTNRISMNYDEAPRQRPKCNLDEQQFGKDDSRTKRYSAPRGKIRMGFDLLQGKTSEDQNKRCSMRLDKDKPPRVSQSKTIVDRSKRHSANYSSHIPDPKDSKHKFKRHSLEVTECNPSERVSRLKRNFTLDVNHNQGSSSKISSLRSALASGSRTAPVTRASSPIRAAVAAHLTSFDHDDRDDVPDYSMERHFTTKFSSSDEEVDKLCIRFAYLEPPNIRDDRSSTRASRLPVWMRRKKP